MAANSNEDMPSVAGFQEESSPSQINTVEHDDENNVESAAVPGNSDLVKNPEEHGMTVDIPQTTKENDDNNEEEENCASEQTRVDEYNSDSTRNGKVNPGISEQSVATMKLSDNFENPIEESTTAVVAPEELMGNMQATGKEEYEANEEDPVTEDHPVTEDQSETVAEFENAADPEETAELENAAELQETAKQNEGVENSEAQHASVEDFACDDNRESSVDLENDLATVKELVHVSSDLDVPVDDFTGNENSTSVEDTADSTAGIESAEDSTVLPGLGDSTIKEPGGSTSEDSQDATPVDEPEDSQDAPPVDEPTESVAEKQNDNLPTVDIDEKVAEKENNVGEEEIENTTDQIETVNKDAEDPAEINEFNDNQDSADVPTEDGSKSLQTEENQKNDDAEEDTEMETGQSEPTNEVNTKSIEDSESVMETDQEENSSINTKDTADEKKETESIADIDTVMETDQIKEPATEENKDEGKEDTKESKQEEEKEPKEETKQVDEEAIDIPKKNEKSAEKDLNDEPEDEMKKLSKEVSLDDSKSKDSGDDISIVGIESKSSEPVTIEDDSKDGEKKDRTSKATQNKDSSKESKSKTPQKCIVCQKVHVGRCNTPTMAIRPRKVPRLTQKNPEKSKTVSHIKTKNNVLYGKVTKPKSNSSKITQKLLHNALLSKEFKKQKTSTNIVKGRMANKMAKISARKIAMLKIDRSGTKILDIAVKFLKLNFKKKFLNNSTNKTQPVTKSKGLRPTTSLASRSTKSLKAAKLLLTSRSGPLLVNKNLKKKYTRLKIKPKLKKTAEKQQYNTTSEEARLRSIHKLEYIRRDNYDKNMQSPKYLLDLDKTLFSDRNQNEHISVDDKSLSCNNTPKSGLEKQIEKRYVKVHLNALNISGSTVLVSSSKEKSSISLQKSRSSERDFSKSVQPKFKSSEPKVNLKSAKPKKKKVPTATLR